MGVVKQIDIKNQTYYFTMTWLISKNLIQACWKSIKNHIKTLEFTTLDTLQLKNWWLWKYL